MQRPTSVTVFGVLNIVFGALGFVAITFSAITLMAVSAGSTANNPVLEIMRNSPGYALWMKITIPLGVLASGISFVAVLVLKENPLRTHFHAEQAARAGIRARPSPSGSGPAIESAD